MTIQHIDYMDVDSNVLIVALAFRFRISRTDPDLVRKVLIRAYDLYYDATTTRKDVKMEWIEPAITQCVETGELPFYALRPAADMVRKAEEIKFAMWLSELETKQNETMECIDESTNGRVLRGEISKPERSAHVSL